MATLVTFYDRLLGKGAAQADEQARSETRQIKGGYKLRSFPNEDVHFFVKRIDNSHVIREADPQARKVCWKLIGGAGTAAVLLIGLLLPTGYKLMAGYQIQALRSENNELQLQKAALEMEEAKLLSPERLAELARLQEFVDPEPG